MQVSIFDFEVTDHDSSHHFVASTVEFARGCSVLRSPLEIHNVKFGPMLLRPVHAPQPGIATQNFETGAQADDHIRFFSRTRCTIPIDRPFYGAPGQ